MSETEGEQESKEARAKSVERQLNDEQPPKEPPQNEPGPSKEVGGASSVGESVNRRGEDLVDKDGKEPGRHDTGTDEGTGRPVGESTSRDRTGVDTQNEDEE
ncbi:MAG: hypothetical protein ACR2LQ_03085 [Acidimicrobiales bacterium]